MDFETCGNFGDHYRYFAVVRSCIYLGKLRSYIGRYRGLQRIPDITADRSRAFACGYRCSVGILPAAAGYPAAGGNSYTYNTCRNHHQKQQKEKSARCGIMINKKELTQNLKGFWVGFISFARSGR